MNKKIFIAIAIFAFIYISIYSTGIVATFATALSFAYLLHPLARNISGITKINYKYAAILVSTFFITILVSFLVFFIPKLLNQMQQFVSRVPEYQVTLKETIIPHVSDVLKKYGGEQLSDQFMEFVNNSSVSLRKYLMASLNSIWTYTISIINIISLIFLFPIVLIFFLIDWPKFTDNFREFIKNIGLESINSICDEADDLIAGFIRSIFNVGAIMSIVYVIAFGAISLDYFLILGIFAGFAVIVPFIGPFIITSSCLLISFLNEGLSHQLLWIITIFAVVQTFEGSYLTPKIVGDRIGLHPNAIIFSVFVSTSIFGFVGLFIAIPVAGLVRIIFRKFVLEK
jgi:putative permease